MNTKRSIVYRVFRYLFRNIGHAMNAPFYHYYCPVCKSKVEAFDISLLNCIDYIEPKQAGFQYDYLDFETLNATNYGHKSYKCGCSDKERLIALYIKTCYNEILDKKKRGLIVDFAPNNSLTNYIVRIKPKSYQYRTADKFMDNVDDKVDIQCLPYLDNSIDLFICSHVLEHVNNDRQAMSELNRVLKPGGIGILLVPICTALASIIENNTLKDENEQMRLFGGKGHLRLYNQHGFSERLIQSGFQLRLPGVDFFGKETFNKSGITHSSKLYIVSK